MILISDNDILLKLSACHLMEEAVVALESALADVYVLSTARYKISRDRGGKLQSQYGADGVAGALAFIDSVSEIDQEPLPGEQVVLAQVEDIDPGEQILFGATAYFNPFLLATGDKRSLRALWSAPACAPICVRMSGRVLCLEQIVSRLVPHLGFDEIRSRIVPARECDTVLKAAFGSGLQAEESQVLQHLANRVMELRADTGHLLHPL